MTSKETDEAVDRIRKKINFKPTDRKEDMQKKLNEYLTKSNSKKLKDIIEQRLLSELVVKEEIKEEIYPKHKEKVISKDKAGKEVVREKIIPAQYFKIITHSRRTKTGDTITYTITIKRPRKAFTTEQDAFIRRNISDSNRILAKAFKQRYGYSKSDIAFRDRKARLEGRKK